MRGLRKLIIIGSLAMVMGLMVFVFLNINYFEITQPSTANRKDVITVEPKESPISENQDHKTIDPRVEEQLVIDKPIIQQEVYGDEKYHAAAEKLRKTGDRYLDMIMNDEEGDGFTNHVMAEINYRAYLSFELTDSLRAEYEDKLQRTKVNDDNCSIFSGISKNGVMFIAIAYPQQDSESYEKTINTISENENEFQLFNSFLEPPGLRDRIYYAVDLYVEDLVGDKKEFKVELWEPSVGAVDYPVKHSESDVNVSNILKKFNRANPTNIIQNKKWNLFLFNSYPIRPSFMLRYDDEDIELEG